MGGWWGIEERLTPVAARLPFIPTNLPIPLHGTIGSTWMLGTSPSMTAGEGGSLP